MRKAILMILAAAAALLTACESSGEGGEPASASSAPVPAADVSNSTDELQNSESFEISAASEAAPEKEESNLNIIITANGREFTAELYDNETANALKKRLPLTLEMSELNGNEKYYYLPEGLPTNSSKPSMIHSGDIMLFGSDCLVIFYEDFKTSYSYTPIGKINDPDGLAAALGGGGVTVSFEGQGT